MKLHVYQQDKSNMTWVRDDEFTPEEQADAGCTIGGVEDEREKI